MVTVDPNPPPGQCFIRFYAGGDPMDMKGTENGSSVVDTTSFWNGFDDPSKKVRKTYTITKSRENWSELEHHKFLEALHLFDRDWKKIEAFVGSKTVIQIRSHAQKYFLKVQKNGATEHVPPPRPKRKSARPYPQKPPKYVASQLVGPLSSTPLLESRNTVSSAPLAPWSYNGVTTGCESSISKDDFGPSGVTMMHNCSSSGNETPPCIWTSNETNRQVNEKLDKEERVTPDFAQVYSFIGSVFDPSASDHLQRLKKMDPVNLETALMLMKNLSVNLVSPESENHRRLLSSSVLALKTTAFGA